MCYDFRVKKAILGLIFLGLLPALQAQSDWVGLWRISRIYNGKTEGVYHLFVQLEEGELHPTIYLETARPMTLHQVAFHGDENVLEVEASNSERQPLPMRFKFALKENQISGEWTFAHMQLTAPVTGNLTGFRVLSDPKWDPWGKVEDSRGQRFLDLTELLSKAPLEQFGPFQRFWNREIESKYYFLLTRWVYGEDKAGLPHKRKVLRELFNQLQNEEFRKKALDLEPIAERVIRTTKLVRETDDIGLFLISFPAAPRGFEEFVWSRVPTAQEEAQCACKLDLRERFIFLDPTRFSETSNNPILMEKEALARSLWPNRLPALPIQVFRQALALAFAVEVNGGEWSVPLESVEAAKIEFAPLLLEPEPMMKRELEPDLAISLSYNLGLAFVQRLRGQHSLTELLSMGEPEIMKGWHSFLGASSSKQQVSLHR